MDVSKNYLLVFNSILSMTVSDKFLVRVWDEDKTNFKEKRFKTTQEIIDFLGISRHAYNNLVAGRTKKMTPKTEFLKNIDIIRFKASDTKEDIKRKTKIIKNKPIHDSKKKLNEIFNKME